MICKKTTVTLLNIVIFRMHKMINMPIGISVPDAHTKKDIMRVEKEVYN